MNYELRLYLDRLTAKSASLVLKKTHARALYIVEGSLAIKNGVSTSLTLSQNSAISIPELFTLSGGSVEATVLRWELVDEADSPCLLYTSPSPRDGLLSRMPSSA